MRPAGELEPLAALVGEHRVGDAGVAVALALRTHAVALEPVEQPRDARGGEQQPLGEVDAAQRAVLGVGEVEQRLVVVDRQAVVGDAAVRDSSRSSVDVGAQQPREGGDAEMLEGSILD